MLLLLSSQDSSEGKTVQEWWHVKNSTKQKKEIGSTPVIGQKKKSLLLEKSMHAVSILTIRWKLSCLPHTHIPIYPYYQRLRRLCNPKESLVVRKLLSRPAVMHLRLFPQTRLLHLMVLVWECNYSTLIKDPIPSVSGRLCSGSDS